jgi:hypothetical protein
MLMTETLVKSAEAAPAAARAHAPARANFFIFFSLAKKRVR